MREWDAVGTARRIAAGEVTVVEVVEAAIARAEAVESTDPPLGALVTPSFDTARIASRRPMPGPLAGVPTVVKDLDDVAGVPTGQGSAALGGYVPTRTGPAVRQLLATGLVSLGKSAAPELGLTASTEPLHLPPTRNPWHPGHSTGGSSGGSAALVAAGVVPIASATDGGGSIRIPAALCGLVGLKPSYGRLVELPTQARLPVRVAVPGVLTTTVRDTVAWYAAAERVAGSPAGHPPIGHVTVPPERRLRIGLTTADPTGSHVASEVVRVVEDAAATLEDAGHEVELVPSPVGAAFAEAYTDYWALLAQLSYVWGVEVHGRRFRASALEPWTRWLAARARRRALRLPAAVRQVRAAGPAWTRLLRRVDVVVSPVTNTPAPPLGHLAPDVPGEEHLARIRALVPWTALHNATGAPALSLPLGRAPGGLPVGVQLAAAVGDDRTLLELALLLEQAMPWPRHAPVREQQVTATGTALR